jgi:large subunit ribosomal protein L24
MKFKKGDTIIVIAGKDAGKEGTIDRVYKKQNKVLVNDVNMYKKHVRKSEQMPQGGIVDLPRPIDASNVMLKDPKTGKPTRIGFQVKDGKRQRVAKKSNTILK